jgi:hypothetical protein
VTSSTISYYLRNFVRFSLASSVLGSLLNGILLKESFEARHLFGMIGLFVIGVCMPSRFVWRRASGLEAQCFNIHSPAGEDLTEIDWMVVVICAASLVYLLSFPWLPDWKA